jgi:hypothetical protein
MFELSQFPVVIFNQCEKSEFKYFLHRRRSPNMHTFSIQSFLAGDLLPLGNLRSSSIPHSDFLMQPNRK